MARKRLFSIICCMFFLSLARLWGQEMIFYYPLNQRTMGPFNDVCANISRHNYVTGDFTQDRLLSRTNRSLLSSGNFIIAAELGMVWDTLSPVRTSVTLASDYIIEARGNRRTVMSAQGNETFLRTAEVLSMVFTGNAQGLINNFDVYFTGSAASWEIGLVPKTSAIRAYMQKIIISGDADIRFFQITEQAGDVVTYYLSNHRYPAGLSANERAFFTLP